MDLTREAPACLNCSSSASASALTPARLPQLRWCAGAREDPLTGLLAFPDFHQSLPPCLVATLEDGALVALAIGDVDGLKEHVESTNSTDPASYGHLAGNAVMARLGEIARGWFREQPWTAGCVATFGGDEVIVAVREEDPSRFLAAVQDVRDRLCLALPVTVSFAVTIVAPGHLPADREEQGWQDRFTDGLFAAVDRCLFVHKAARRQAQIPGGIIAVTGPGPAATPSAKGLFPLPSGPGEVLHATAMPTQVGGQTVLLLPCLGPVGMRGHRMRVAPGYQRPATEVVLSVRGQAALAAPSGGAERPLPVILSTVRGNAPLQVPKDLEAALAGAGLDWAALPTPEQDQLLHLIRESADLAIRSARIGAAITAVSACMRSRR
jgi:GGDEF domain-containing protein